MKTSKPILKLNWVERKTKLTHKTNKSKEDWKFSSSQLCLISVLQCVWAARHICGGGAGKAKLKHTFHRPKIPQHTHGHPFCFSQQEGHNESRSHSLRQADFSHFLNSFCWPVVGPAFTQTIGRKKTTTVVPIWSPWAPHPSHLMYPIIIQPSDPPHRSLWSTCRSRRTTTGWWCHTPAGSPEERHMSVERRRVSSVVVVGRDDPHLSPAGIRAEDGAEPPLSWGVPEGRKRDGQSAQICSAATKQSQNFSPFFFFFLFF